MTNGSVLSHMNFHCRSSSTFSEKNQLMGKAPHEDEDAGVGICHLLYEQ